MNTKSFSNRVICALLVGLWINNLHAAGANPVDYTFNFSIGGTVVPTQVRAWVPDSVDRLKGLILNIPGSGNDTRGMIANSLWQFQAEQMGFGIVGFRDLQGFPVLAGVTSQETRSNLQQVLDAVAGSFLSPEVKNAPIILDGISKGGYGVSQLAPFLADRTICYIADKGYAAPAATPEELLVPGIAIGGGHDEAVPPAQVYSSFTTSRLLYDAKLAQLVDWGHGHLATSSVTKFAFMDQALRVRYPQNMLPSLTPNTPFPLVNISQLPGAWLAEANPLDDTLTSFAPIDDPVITPAAAYSLDPVSASWLPTEAMAMVYRAHNDRSATADSLRINVTRFFGEVTLAISLSNIAASSIRLYHNEELIDTLSPGSNSFNYTYYPKRNGLHTFIAIADYLDNGVMMQTSNYTATVVAGVVTVPEPGTGMLLIAGGGTGCLRRKRKRIPHKEI